MIGDAVLVSGDKDSQVSGVGCKDLLRGSSASLSIFKVILD